MGASRGAGAASSYSFSFHEAPMRGKTYARERGGGNAHEPQVHPVGLFRRKSRGGFIETTLPRDPSGRVASSTFNSQLGSLHGCLWRGIPTAWTRELPVARRSTLSSQRSTLSMSDERKTLEQRHQMTDLERLRHSAA